MIADLCETHEIRILELTPRNKGYSLEFRKTYGQIEYCVTQLVDGKNKKNRGLQQKSIRLEEITKNANDRASHPTAFSKDFIRTEIINPITNYIKQNYKNEARDIALYAKDHDTALIAPNGKVIVSELDARASCVQGNVTEQKDGFVEALAHNLEQREDSE